ncbi:MAG: hypothetical protein MR016_10815 [Agathobacter sp.]|nr:hypothetical protein [Agathobacter sp.]
MDYRKYTLSARDFVVIMGKAAGITGCVAWLFYESLWAVILFPLAAVILAKSRKREQQQKRQIRLETEFLDALRAVSASLCGGYSMENAWKEAQKEIRMLHGDNCDMYRELAEINRSVTLSVPLEKLLAEFGARSGAEDIESFAEVFAFAKRSGGNFLQMIETTTEHIRIRQETSREIAVAVASRELEQKVMNVIPMFILAYLRIGMGDYLDPLYHNAFGVVFMTVCLAVYAFAVFLSGRIMAIRM